MTATMEVREAEWQHGVGVLPPQETVPPTPVRMARSLFSDCLLEPVGFERSRRRWATMGSFVIQCAVLGVLLIIPLMFTEELPRAQLLTFLIAPPPPPPPPAAETMAKVVKRMQSDLLESGGLRTPTRIPQKVEMVKEEAAPPLAATGGVIGGVPGGIPGGQLGGVIGGIINSANSTTIVPKLEAMMPKRIRISQGVTSGMLTRKVEPIYPPIALRARITGQVLLKAIIDRNGDIQNLEVVSGHPLLIPPAIAAVKQWHYRPYLLNGLPVEVETTITVTFLLNR